MLPPLLLFLAGPLLLERDVAPAVNGPNPGATGNRITQLLSRPGGYWAMYDDERSIDEFGTSVGLRGARLSAALDAVDLTGNLLPVDMSAERIEAVHDGAAVVLAWVAMPTDQEPRTIVAARVSETGTLLAGPRALATTTGEVGTPSLAFDGARAIVAWVEGEWPQSVVRAAAFHSAGATEGPWTLAQGMIGSLTAASSGGATLVAWITDGPAGGSTLDAVRIPQGGAPPAPAALASRAGLLGLASVGMAAGAWYLSWSEGAEASDLLYGAALPAAGPLGTPVVIQAVTSDYGIEPHLAFSGSDVRALWTVYLDIWTRTVPLSGAPTLEAQEVRSRLAYEPSASVACSEGACAAAWVEPAPGVGLTPAVRVSRLSAGSAALDVPAKEISFPADAHGRPELAYDGQAWVLFFTRQFGRGDPVLFRRRFDAAGAWLDSGLQALAPGLELKAVAPVPGGGLLVGAGPASYSTDSSIFGYRLSANGDAESLGPWVGPGDLPEDVELACGARRCGLVYEQNAGYLTAVLDPSGAVLARSAVLPPELSGAEWVRLRSVGSTLVAVHQRSFQSVRAILAEDTDFPSFSAPIPLSSSTASALGSAVRSAQQGGKLALVWTEQSCRVVGRVFDVVAAAAVGSDAVELHQCSSLWGGRALGVLARPGGYAVLFEEKERRDGRMVSDYFLRETDLALQPTGAARLVDTVEGDREGMTVASVGGREVYAYTRFDDCPGISAWRVKLAGLDDGASAGACQVAALPADGGADGGVADGGGPEDAGSLVDGGPSDGGAPDAGGTIAGGDATAMVPAACGCGTAGAPFVPWIILALWRLLVVRRSGRGSA